MTEETKQNPGAMSEEVKPKTVYKMHDNLIVMVREIIQLSLLTGTSIVDHFRALQIEPLAEDPRYLTVTPEYVEAYNVMIKRMNDELTQKQADMQGEEALPEKDLTKS